MKNDRVEVTISKIENGFVVSDKAHLDYSSQHSDLKYYPTLQDAIDSLSARVLDAADRDVAIDSEPYF